MGDNQPATFLLLPSLLPAQAVQLGRFVRLPYHPGSAYAPQKIDLPRDLIVPSIEEDVNKLLTSGESKTGFGLSLGKLLKASGASGTTAERSFSSRTVITRRFLNADSYKARLFADPEIASWLKEPEQIRARVVYLVVGYKTFVDAQVIESYKKARNLSLDAKLPVDELAMILGLPPGTVPDIGSQLEASNTVRMTSDSIAKGEQVFAVEYRPLRVKSMRLEDVAHLGKSTYGGGSTRSRAAQSSKSAEGDVIDPEGGRYILRKEKEAFELELEGLDLDEFGVTDLIDDGEVASQSTDDGTVWVFTDPHVGVD